MIDTRYFIQHKSLRVISVCGPSLLAATLSASAQAQIVTADGSAGTSISNAGSFSITEGTLRSTNGESALFHSFDTFSPGSAAVVFDLRDSQNVVDTGSVSTIIGRVTGSSNSFINGALSINQDSGTPIPDLFLINPNGIEFGFGAFVNVPGSFVASTAENILFDEGTVFSALDAANPVPLLTVSTPVGLQMGANSAGISNSGIVYTSGIDTTSALIGSDITFFGGGLYAESGHTELGSIGPQVQVNLTPSSTGWAFDYSNVDTFGDISLFSSVVNPSNRGSGSFQLVGNDINLTFGSQVFAFNRGQMPVQASVIDARESLEIQGYSDPLFGQDLSLLYTYAISDGNAGDLMISAPQLQLSNGGRIISLTQGAGDAGDINISTTALEASRLAADGGTGIFNVAFASATGSSGDIAIDTKQLTIDNGVQFLTRTFGAGDSGDIVVQAEDISVGGNLPGNSDASGLQARVEAGATGNGGNVVVETASLLLTGGARLSAETLGSSNSGSVLVDATSVEIAGASAELTTGLYSTVNPGAQGNSSGIEITTDELIVRDGGRVFSRSEGVGDAGNISIDAEEILVTGANVFDDQSSLISATVEEIGEGNAGNIDIRANSLTLSGGGQVASELRSVGSAGNITLDIDDIVVTGTTPAGSFRSVVTTAVTDTGQGEGGNIVVNSENLTISDGAELFAATVGEGNAGNIAVETNNLTLSGGGKIQSASDGTGDAGNVVVDADGLIDVSGATLIEDNYSGIYSSIGANGMGSAGDIELITPQLRVREGGQINSSVLGIGEGGEITINAEEVLITGTSPLGTNPSLIAANIETSGQGNAGNIVLVSNSLTLSDGGQIFSSSAGIGNGGDITINAQDISLMDTSVSDAFPSFIGSRINPNAEGDGGDINLITERLSVGAAGVVSTSTLGKGNAGNITIQADDVVVEGTNAADTRKSFIVTSVEPTGEGSAGNIDLETRRLSVREGGQISTTTFGNGDAGNITVNATDLSVVGASISEATSSIVRSSAEDGTGDAGDIQIATHNLTLSRGGQIASGTASDGEGGDVTVTANDLLIEGASPTDAFISIISTATTPNGQGDSGDINVAADRIRLREGGQIFSGTAGIGDSGNIALRADEILISGVTPVTGNDAAVSTAVQPSGQGNAGDIEIATRDLALTDGGQITSDTRNVGNGGNLSIVAEDILVSGNLSSDEGSVISTGVVENAEGNAGRLEILTERLDIERGGVVGSRTAGRGDAGALSIEATERIRLEGRSTNGELASQISANVDFTATGTGGDLRLTTELLEVLNGAEVTTGTVGDGAAGTIAVDVGSLLVQGMGEGEDQPSRLTASSNSDFTAGSLLVTVRDGVALRDGAELSVSSLFTGDAGNLGLSADSVRLTNGSRIEARTTAGDRGNVDLTANQLILLDQTSQITTDATNTATGGNINITSPIIVGNGNSDITANAVEGAGGNISITAEGLFGLQFRDRLTPANDITASSEIGLNGNVVIDLPVIDPTNALAQLPAVVLDPSDQIAAGCIADTGANFVATGRGGVPIDPTQGQLEGSSLQSFDLSPEGVAPDNWRSHNVVAVSSQAALRPLPQVTSQEKTLSEANGWHYTDRGEVQLTTAVSETLSPLVQSSHVSNCLQQSVG